MEKICKKCGETNQAEFYKQQVSECKSCTRERVRNNRIAKIEYYREYDRKRGNRQSPEYVKDYRNKYPNKYKATNMVNNAIRDKKLFREPCESCGSTSNIHAHHDDYSKPLNVRWLCAPCHSQWHMENGEGINA